MTEQTIYTVNCPRCKSGNIYPLFQGSEPDPKDRWGCGECGAAFAPTRDAPMTPEQAAVKKQIDRIESTLHALLRCLEQERADLGTADYARASELAHVAGQLEQAESFWTQSGPEYTE